MIRRITSARHGAFEHALHVALLMSLFLASAAFVSAASYTSFTIAGAPGIAGSADGTNGNARFNQPWGVTVDNAGNVFVSEWENSTIRKLTRTGTNWVVTTIAGVAGQAGSADGTNSDARLNHPHGLVADSAGNLYVADTFNNAIRKITFLGTNSVVTTIAGKVGVFGTVDGTNTDAEFYNPNGITLDTFGNLFVADAEADTIRKIQPVGSNWVVSTIAGFAGQEGSTDGTNSAARFFGPFDVKADTNGNLYVPDYENCTIRKIRQAGTNWVVTTIAGSPGVQGYADGINNAALLAFPRALIADKAGNVFLADTETDTIRFLSQVGTNWVIRTIIGLPWRWGYADGTGASAQFDTVSGIALDSRGNLYLADLANNVIRQILPPPPPSITLAANEAVLAWPSWATNFFIETCTSLTSGLWSPLTNGVVVSGSSLVLSNNPNRAAAFFRLNGP
jgi:hypothetical protein